LGKYLKLFGKFDAISLPLGQQIQFFRRQLSKGTVDRLIFLQEETLKFLKRTDKTANGISCLNLVNNNTIRPLISKL